MSTVPESDVDWLLEQIAAAAVEDRFNQVDDSWEARAVAIVERLADRYPNEWRIELDSVLDPKGRAPLSLNDRHHWAKHAALVARVKAATRNAALAAEIPHLSHVHVEMHYRPATNRFRDIDNLVATMKPVIDALHTRDESPNAPIEYAPIVDGDDPRYLTATWPILHPWEKGRPPGLWLIIRSAG